MNQATMDIFEALLFFIILAVTFKAIVKIDITKHFEKGAIWQMQITYVFLSIGLSYLVLKAIMNLVEISRRLFT